MRRRTYLALVGSLSLGGCLGGGGGGDSNESYGDWFDGVSNYDEEVDQTGREEVTVAVGAVDGLAFEPAAVRVSQGTRVVWEWTGDGGRHNVVDEGSTFQSEYHEDEGATFAHRFDDPGLFRYYCEPHRTLGMRGGVRVVEP
jgi:halocyanin-like protein